LLPATSAIFRYFFHDDSMSGIFIRISGKNTFFFIHRDCIDRNFRILLCISALLCFGKSRRITGFQFRIKGCRNIKVRYQTHIWLSSLKL
jgi:hypothetical protein